MTSCASFACSRSRGIPRSETFSIVVCYSLLKLFTFTMEIRLSKINDRKDFRDMFLIIVKEAFDAAEELAGSRDRLSGAIGKLSDLGGGSFASTILDLVTEERRSCDVCSKDFMASETRTDRFAECSKSEMFKKFSADMAEQISGRCGQCTEDEGE